MSTSISPFASATKPRWVLYNGALCNVSDFAHLPAKERPQTFCPHCDRAVTLKLGNVRTHHYAHAHDCDCAVNYPETALHFNTKFHFYRELQRAIGTPFAQLYLLQKCKQDRCGASRNWAWLRDWDAVEVEYRMDSLRPDIALLREGEVVSALEILVTHAVDERKAAVLEGMGIPWAEIEAKESLSEGETAWNVTAPLPINRHHPHLPEWTCPECEQKIIDRRDREEAEAKQREFERLNHTKVYADRMVDYYFSDGQKYRDVFEVIKVVENGQVARAVLCSERRGNLCRVEGPLTKETLDHFVELANAEVGYMKEQDTIVDQVMPWREHRSGKEMAACDLRNFPWRYYWSTDNKAWLRVQKAPPLPSRPATSPATFEFGKYPCLDCGRVTSDWYVRFGQSHCRCNECLRKQNAQRSGTL